MSVIRYPQITMKVLLVLLFSLAFTTAGRPPPMANDGCVAFFWTFYGQIPGRGPKDFPMVQSGPYSYMDNQDGVTEKGKSLQLEYYATKTGIPVRFMFFKPVGKEVDPHQEYVLDSETTHTATKVGLQEVSFAKAISMETRIAFEVEGPIVPIPYRRGSVSSYSSLSGYKKVDETYIWNSKIVNKEFAFRLGMYAGREIEDCDPNTTTPEPDIDECEVDNGGCDHICINVPGSYYCKCRPEYNLMSNGRTCSKCLGREWVCYGQPPSGHQYPNIRRREDEENIAFVDNQDGVINEDHESIEFEYYASFPGTTVKFLLLKPVDTSEPEPSEYVEVFSINHTAIYKGFNRVPFKFLVKAQTRIGFEVHEDSNPIPYRSAPYRYSTYEGYRRKGKYYVFKNHHTDRSYQFRLCVLHDYIRLNCPTAPPYVDKCKTNNGGCAESCLYLHESDSVECSCKSEGLQLSQDGRSCEDIDECAHETDECDQMCVNTRGSYTCTCNPGFILGRDRHSCF